MRRRSLVGAGAAGVLGALAGLPARAQKYPDGPVTVILPLQAGSASDVALRHMTERLGQRLGGAFVVENVAAAAGLVGLERLARARPDGRTVAALNNSILTILPHLQASKMKGEPRRDYLPIAGVANIPTFFAVPAASPVRTVQDLVQRARRGRVTYSSGGVGSPQHLATEMFNAYTGVKLDHVPYRGASQAALAVASGEVDVMSMALSLAQPFLQDQRVRLIGFCGGERHGLFRDVPTLQEQGVKNYDYSSWLGLFLHKDAPAEVLQALRSTAQAVAGDREFQVQLIRSGLDPWVRSPEQLALVVDQDFQRWKQIIQDAGIPSA
ncbi:Bug family tripartite tricarboxylate transporter substrate binding protein [Rubrivivax sp. RP6-9]|uniref:Bug family tripartite tricarboxylate transporter substrate binding protein n=1 Tax=Rubrivivax sp. RP6-9 TaxID=3415750 RepID=UPI003CC5DEAE